jgi:hypothetical protein
MMRTVILFILLAISTPVWSDADAQIRQLEKTLARIQQESQSTYQEFLIIQELRRNEMLEAPVLIPPSLSGKSVPIPNYEDAVEREQEKQDRIVKYTADLDRLYTRYEELGNEKQEIFEQIKRLEQKPEE